jgi:hypothetical protein
VAVYIHSPIGLHGLVLNQLSTGIALALPLSEDLQWCHIVCSIMTDLHIKQKDLVMNKHATGAVYPIKQIPSAAIRHFHQLYK